MSNRISGNCLFSYWKCMFHKKTPPRSPSINFDPFPILPQDIYHHLFSYLDWEDLAKAQAISKLWQQIVCSEVAERKKNILPYIKGGLKDWQTIPTIGDPVSLEMLASFSRTKCSQRAFSLPSKLPVNSTTLTVKHFPLESVSTPFPNDTTDRIGNRYFTELKVKEKTLKGQLLAFKGEKLIWSFVHSRPFNSDPILDEKGILYLATAGLLAFDTQSIDLKNPKPLWTFTCKENLLEPTIDSNGKLYVQSIKGTLYCFDTQNIQSKEMKPLWTFTPKQRKQTTLKRVTTDHRGHVFIVNGAHFYVFDSKSIDPKNPQPIYSCILTDPNDQFIFFPFLDFYGRVFLCTLTGDILIFEMDQIKLKQPEPSFKTHLDILWNGYPFINSQGKLYLIGLGDLYTITPGH